MWRRRHRERGAAAVEMAMVLPLLMLAVGGIVDLGWLLFHQVTVSNAAREGARMAAIYGYGPNGIRPQVELASSGIGSVGISTQLYDGATAVASDRCPASPSSTMSIRVTVTATSFQWTMLDVVPSLVGGTIPKPTPNATGSMRCAG
jgi:Flp pilus assembly protein TadG